MAHAFHAKRKIRGGADHYVGIGNLRVMIVQDGVGWFAQGLELDYAAEGTSFKDAQVRFQAGLESTVDEHLKANGHIQKLLRPAPGEVWAEFYRGEHARLTFTQVSFHRVKGQQALPFEGITFIAPKRRSTEARV
jgi:hypothetical protein